MFDIGWSELLIIGVIALIAIGPKELPGVLRAAGQWMGKIRRMASEFQGQFQEAMREAELDDIKKQVDDLGNTASSMTDFDPIGSIGKEFENAIEDKPAAEQGESSTTTEPSAPEPSTAGSSAAEPSTAETSSAAAAEPPAREPGAQDAAADAPTDKPELATAEPAKAGSGA